MGWRELPQWVSYGNDMLLPVPPQLEAILRDLDAAGFRAILVGGAVRDALLGLEPKDFDIEVYGIAYDRLAGFLAQYGRVDLVGKSFGVVKLSSWDFSIPRRESKTGPHHRDFHATFDESITPREAASRRDFTINAIGYNPIRNEVLDFFGGQEDLKNRVLRATSSAFREDPLRVLRGMQFACRFNLVLDPVTAEVSHSIAGEYGTLAIERVAEEFMKWAVKSDHPGLIASYLKATGWDAHFPEIAALAGVPQDPGWHPEGDVGAHTMLVLDAAARIANRERLEGDERVVLLFSALCHDFAKPATTQLREREGRMRWTSWGHEAEGGPLARAFLERIGIKAAIVSQVVALVENHLASSSVGREPSPRAIRRLAMRLAPANILQLLRLIEADHSGRPPLPPGLPGGAVRIREMAIAQAVEEKPQAPLIQGRHVLPYFDNQPGRHIGQVVNAALEAQADGEFSTQEEALAWLERHIALKRP
jgi:tRNA nucleotidyltransferase (CCA-adding enzyme)